MVTPKTTAMDIERMAQECEEAGKAITLTLTLPVSWPRPPGFPKGDLVHADGHGVCYAYDPARLLHWLKSLRKRPDLYPK